MIGFNLNMRHPPRLFRGRSKSIYTVLISFFLVSIILNRLRLGGLFAYIVPSMCWAIVAVLTIYLGGGLSKFISWTNSRIAFMALLSASFQIFIMIDAGLINGFGKNPLSFEPMFIIINSTLVTSTLLGRELSRGYLVKNLNKKRPELTLTFITILYTFTNVSIFSLLNYRDPLVYSTFMGKTFLPTLTSNLLATYVAQIGGPLASLAYYTPLKAFQWFSPILPDLPWGYESIIGVMTPTIGFVVITQATTKMDQMRAGILHRNRGVSNLKRNGGTMKGWLLLSVFFVIATWTSTGLLGFYPTVIASGSMRPTMDVGDMAIVVKVDPKDIIENDIIQYWKDGAMFLHRVIVIRRGDEGLLYVTKGDANRVTDIDPVFQGQIKGKLIFTLPYIGWISIYTKQIMFTIWSYLISNIFITYSTLTIIMVSILSYFIINYYRRSKIYKYKKGWFKR